MTEYKTRIVARQPDDFGLCHKEFISYLKREVDKSFLLLNGYHEIPRDIRVFDILKSIIDYEDGNK